MKRLPTDLEILEEIYNRYYSGFASYSEDSPNRQDKIYMPIDIEVISKHFSVDPDIIFGRLYYHLEKKYGYTQPNGSKVYFFNAFSGPGERSIHFPLLASVLASMKEEQEKYLVSTWLSIAAIIISIGSLVVSLIFSH